MCGVVRTRQMTNNRIFEYFVGKDERKRWKSYELVESDVKRFFIQIKFVISSENTCMSSIKVSVYALLIPNSTASASKIN